MGATTPTGFAGGDANLYRYVGNHPVNFTDPTGLQSEKGSLVPSDLPDEVFETLVLSDQVRIERIVSQGHASPPGFWYDQDQAEFVMLLQGKAWLRFEGDDPIVELNPGDYLTIPAHCRHRVERTAPEEPTVWLAVHYA